MKYLRKTGRIVSLTFFCVLLAAGVGLIVLRIAGYKLLAVETGSMGNVYPVGSMIVVDSSLPEEICPADVISFVVDDELTIVTHRVIDVDEAGRCFYTKGDMNNVADANPVLYENLLGKVILGIPYAGYLLIFLRNKMAAAAFAVIVTIIILYDICRFLYKKLFRRKELPHEQAYKKNPQK